MFKSDESAILTATSTLSDDAKTITSNNSLTHKILYRPHSLKIRKLIFDLHFWCGVALSIYLAVLSLSGSALVFREELDTLLSPQKPLSITGSRIGFAPIIKAVEDAYPGHKVSGIINTFEPSQPLKIYATDASSNYITVLSNQYSGEVIGLARENSVLKFLQDLHFNLLLSRPGRIANAFGGAILLLISVSGIILWWKGLRNWTSGLKVKFPSHLTRLNWDLHNAVGFWTLPFVFVWGVSSIYFGFRSEFERVVNTIFPVSSLRVTKETAVLKKTVSASLDIDSRIAIAMSKVPSQTVARIAVPKTDAKPLQIWFTETNSYKKDDNTEVDVDSSGNVLAVSTPEQRSSGDQILIWLSRLHFGNFAGVVVKALWVVLGLAPLLLSATGLVMWWNRSLRHKRPKK